MNRSVFWTITLLLAITSVKTSEAETIESADFPELKNEASRDLMKRMFISSELVFIGEFENWKTIKSGQSDAIFKYIDVLKGPWLGSTPLIRYKIPSTKLTEGNESKSNALLIPAMNSKWILFVPKVEPIIGPWKTFNGEKGRVKYSEENLKTLFDAIESCKLNRVTRNGLTLRAFPYIPMENSEIDFISKDPKYNSDMDTFYDLYKNSEVIFLGKYKHYEIPDNVAETKSIIAVYEPIEYFKGKEFNSNARINYTFSDRNLEATNKADWTYKIPSKGSKWILFLQLERSPEGAWKTYNDAKGRIPYNGWTNELLLRTIERIKGSIKSQ